MAPFLSGELKEGYHLTRSRISKERACYAMGADNAFQV